MILIAHRGNINGPNPETENEPDNIQSILALGYDVEIDVWYADGWWLGHDLPQYEIDFSFLNQSGLWIHCKNYDALQRLIPTDLNFFYHTDEDYALTSKRFIWAYPGQPGGDHTICVMPETPADAEGFVGVCSDRVVDY